MAFLTSSIAVDLVIFAATLSAIIYKYFTWHFDYWKKRKVPYLQPKVLFGNIKKVVTFEKSLGLCLADFYAETKGDFFGIWVFGTPYFVPRNPELIKNILVKDFNYFRDRTVLCAEVSDTMSSKMLFFQQGQEWKTMRNKVSPIFTSGKIKNMVTLMNEAAKEYVSYLHEHSGKSIDAKEPCAKFTTDVITSCAFGIHAESFRHEDAVFRSMGRRMFDFKTINALRSSSYFYAPSIVKLFRYPFFEQAIYDFFRGVFWETLNSREKQGFKRNDLIDIILELRKNKSLDGVKFEGDAVVAQAMQFYAAGFETTSSAITFTLYEMCLNPQIQTKLRTEILKVLEEDGGITFESLHKMKYLDKVLKETLRKYPVLPFLDRRCLQDYKIPGTDVVLEKGTPVYIPLYGLHFDPQYFPDPHKFDPERFSDEAIKARPSYAYFPFGDGPHNCIGERFGLVTSKLGIVQVLSNFSVERSAKTPYPIRFDAKSFILQSVDELHMTFIPVKERKHA